MSDDITDKQISINTAMVWARTVIIPVGILLAAIYYNGKSVETAIVMVDSAVGKLDKKVVTLHQEVITMRIETGKHDVRLNNLENKDN